MLEWLPNLGTFFPEAVNIAIRMPHTFLHHCMVVFELGESDLVLRYPEAVAKLLIYLGQFDSPGLIWHQGGVLINKLLQSGLPSVLEQGLKELNAKIGLT